MVPLEVLYHEKYSTFRRIESLEVYSTIRSIVPLEEQ